MDRGLRPSCKPGGCDSGHAPARSAHAEGTRCRRRSARSVQHTLCQHHPGRKEATYPGDRLLERRIESLMRWNAMAMVHHQNKRDPGIGGHISTYSSLATLLEVGFNHFFHAKYGDQPGDFIYLQGHASPGIYARAFLEGRL